MSVASVPSLDEIAADPEQLKALSPEVTRSLFLKARNLEALLFASLFAKASVPAMQKTDGDRFLDAAEVGAMIGKSRSWVEKNTDVLPQRRRVGGEGKWFAREVQAWMSRAEPWD